MLDKSVLTRMRNPPVGSGIFISNQKPEWKKCNLLPRGTFFVLILDEKSRLPTNDTLYSIFFSFLLLPMLLEKKIHYEKKRSNHVEKY